MLLPGLALAIMIDCATAAAQDVRPGSPFNRFDLSLTRLSLLSTDTLGAFYRPGPLWQIMLASGYHRGSIALGLEGSPYTRTGPAGQDFFGLFPFVRWEAIHPLPGRFDATLGAGFGALIMAFHEAPGIPRARETELGWMAGMGLRHPLTPWVAANMRLEYRRITTSPATSELRLGAGLSTTFGVPRAVRDILLPPGRSVQARTVDARVTGSRDLPDYLRLLDSWDRSTVDGLAWTLSPRGLSPLEAPSWRVFLDGVPLEIGLLGTRDPARLPIPLDYLDLPRTSETPAFAGGGLTKWGAIHLQSRDLPEGFSLSAYGDLGDESGDPGPFRHTPLEGENIQRLGYRPSFHASWRRHGAFISGAISYQAHGAVGRVLDMRDRALPRNWFPIIRRVAPHFSAGWQGDDGSVRGFAGGSDARDVFFFPAWGREIGARNELQYVGLAGTARLGMAEGRVGFSSSSNVLTPERDAAGSHAAWRLDDTWSYVEVGRRGAPESRAGVSLQRRRALFPHTLSDAGDTFWRFYLSDAAGAASGLDVSAGGEMIGEQGNWKGSVTAGARYIGGNQGEAAATIGLVHTLPNERETFWLWAYRGYSLAADQGNAVEIAAPVAGRQVTADLRLRYPLRRELAVTVDLFFRRMTALSVGDARFQWDSVRRIFSSPVRHVPDARGDIGGFIVGVRQAMSRLGEARLSYRHQAVTAGDDAFRRAWQSTPRHDVRLDVGLAAAPDLSIWSQVRYQGERHWSGWEQIEHASNDLWTAEVPGHLSFEVTVRKILAHGRAESRVSFRGPIGGRVRYHPIGIHSKLQLWIGAEVRLGKGV